MHTITTPLLASAISAGRRFALIDVRSPGEHAKAHVPRSINVPLSSEEFTAEVAQRLPHKSLPVVLYSAGPDCDLSARAGRRLERVGFPVVYDHEGGMEAWVRSGNPISSQKTPQRS